MAIEPNDKEQYTAQDIERYHTGGMTAQERHALEKAALDDPFLADALEGYKLTATPAADAKALRALLDQKTGKSKVVPISAGRKRVYPLLRIAALLLLLLGAGWSVYYLMDTKRETLALDRDKQIETTVQNDAPAQVGTDTAIRVLPTTEEVLTFAQPTPATDATGAAAAKTAGKDVAQRQAEEDLPMQPTASAPPPTAEVPMLLRADTTNVAAGIQTQPANNEAAEQARVANAPVTLNGRVVDANNRGIPSASVSINNTRTGITTDQRGFFSLNAPDTSIKATISAMGFESKDITLSNRSQENNIVLKEGNQSLEEVVVTGVNARRKRSVAPTAAITVPEPAEGWEQFNTYIARNRKTAAELGTEETKGAVTLTFTISRKGTPVNIKVEQSLSPKQDAEATRLLKEGPKWDRSKSTRGTVTIKF